MNVRPRISNALTTWIVFIGAFLGAIAGTAAARIALGATLGPLNDDWFYLAMSQYPLSDPVALMEWILREPYSVLGSNVQDAWNSSGLRLYGQPENGLANQPPFAYRVLVPYAVWALTVLGLSWQLAFDLLYALGVGLLGSFAFRLVSQEGKYPAPGIVVAAALAAMVIATRPDSLYPDAMFMGLSMVAIWALMRNKPWVFASVAALTVLTKESGVALVLAWGVVKWRQRELRAWWIAPLLLPLTCLIVPRLVVDVPNSAINLRDLLEQTSGQLWLAVLLTLLLLNLSPAVGLAITGRWHLIARPDRQVAFVGLLLALGTAAVALSGYRMPLLAAPFLVVASSWVQVRSRSWLVLPAFSAFGYILFVIVSTTFPGSALNNALLPVGAVLVAFVGAFLSTRRELSLQQRLSNTGTTFSPIDRQ